MKYEFICKDCGKVLRGRSKAILVLNVQDHYEEEHNEKPGTAVPNIGWDETSILREINQIRT